MAHSTDVILDLEAGTGRNACLMARYLGDQGRIVGLDIGPEMLEQARRRCQHLPVVDERLGNGGA